MLCVSCVCRGSFLHCTRCIVCNFRVQPSIFFYLQNRILHMFSSDTHSGSVLIDQRLCAWSNCLLRFFPISTALTHIILPAHWYTARAKLHNQFSHVNEYRSKTALYSQFNGIYCNSSQYWFQSFRKVGGAFFLIDYWVSANSSIFPRRSFCCRVHLFKYCIKFKNIF